ncbi:sensor domain-containing protein [Microbacterium sp. Se63.02b]|uniref:sensor histidine kinase n=1 Tax=Microbacterium sp. Se63.02b TaxID=2709304 RepID=UPI001AEE5C95|nr:sensor domain-containing protein [Microbacterium sp. Se63.02b]
MKDGRMRRWLRAWGYLAVEAGVSIASVVFLCLGLVLLPLMIISGGVLLMPEAVRGLHGWTDASRRRVGAYRGEELPPIGRVLPPGSTLDERLRFAFSRATGRDCLWLAVQALPVLFVSLVTISLPVAAVNSLAVTYYWQFAPADDPVGSPYPVTSWELAATMPLVAVAYAILSIFLIPLVARLVSFVSATLLATPEKSRLEARVDALTLSRAAALDAHAAELRRIERDLHDGAQNRLVNVVMMLGIAERAQETGVTCSSRCGERTMRPRTPWPDSAAPCTTSTRPSSTSSGWRGAGLVGGAERGSVHGRDDARRACAGRRGVRELLRRRRSPHERQQVQRGDTGDGPRVPRRRGAAHRGAGRWGGGAVERPGAGSPASVVASRRSRARCR